MLAWAAEDDPAKYAAALKMHALDFYRLCNAKRKTIQRLSNQRNK